VHLQLAGLCFLLWLFLIAVFLFNFVEHGYWNSLFAAALTLLTVQIGNYERLTSLNLFAVLMATAVSIGLAALVVLLLVRVQKERERRRTVRIGDSTGMAAENQPAKFVMVVDEAGESKLAE